MCEALGSITTPEKKKKERKKERETKSLNI
jgi:hypothetical protein